MFEMGRRILVGETELSHRKFMRSTRGTLISHSPTKLLWPGCAFRTTFFPIRYWRHGLRLWLFLRLLICIGFSVVTELAAGLLFLYKMEHTSLLLLCSETTWTIAS